MSEELKIENKEETKLYSYGILDPRNTQEAKESNTKLLGANVLGIEVTIPALAKECGLGNIDPQHTDGNAEIAAIEVVLKKELPASGAKMVTVRADLDSIGSMALFSLRAGGEKISDDIANRIKRIAESDKFAKGNWPGSRPLPNLEKLFDDSMANAETDSKLAPIAAAISDFKVSIGERVNLMEKWLLTGEEPQKYKEKWLAERAEIAKAIAEGKIKIDEIEKEKLVAVTSSHRAATSLGYYRAPVVVAENPEFIFQDSKPHKKFTICQFKNGYVDLKAVANELNKLEPGWGGSPTIIGSPQGEESKLETEQVIEIVKRHLQK